MASWVGKQKTESGKRKCEHGRITGAFGRSAVPECGHQLIVVFISNLINRHGFAHCIDNNLVANSKTGEWQPESRSRWILQDSINRAGAHGEQISTPPVHCVSPARSVRGAAHSKQQSRAEKQKPPATDQTNRAFHTASSVDLPTKEQSICHQREAPGAKSQNPQAEEKPHETRATRVCTARQNFQ
jgi:hypothetical protein